MIKSNIYNIKRFKLFYLETAQSSYPQQGSRHLSVQSAWAVHQQQTHDDEPTTTTQQQHNNNELYMNIFNIYPGVLASCMIL